MATLRAYPNGLTMHVNGQGSHTRAKRGQVVGWSRAAVRRHTRWLYSIEAPHLDGQGVAVTLTLRSCPASPEDWGRLRDAWLHRVRRAGAVRWHWVVEWQRRGVPHLHAAVYFPEGVEPVRAGALLLGHWVDAAAPYGARWGSQTAKPIDGAVGWLQYLSKHAARGVAHYQRQGKPAGWTSTGRLWGHGGPWPESEPIDVQVSMSAFYRARRLARAWRVADARRALGVARTPEEARAARMRIRYARRMLACNDPNLSAVRGVSEWIPEALAVQLLEVAAAGEWTS